MNIHSKLIACLLAAGLPAAWATAQDAENPPRRGPAPPGSEGGGPGGAGFPGQRPVPSPIVGALDANGDGVIDQKEIANASAALKKLDKNGDGKLAPDEYRPKRPVGPGGSGGPGGKPGGPPPSEGKHQRQRQEPERP